ncbi:TPA: hypothetical protein HA259_04530 [Thermoplasmata archaeon]|nr:hypothetical protein [Thermoplasmata archaeon]
MRALYLVDEALSEDPATLSRLRSLGEGDEAVVVPLSTLASLSLRKEGIPFLRVEKLFPREKWQALDSKAAELSRRWHEHLSSETHLLRFHGVSIGQALELDFYFIFIDAVRSAEIASALLKDPFDTIYLPPIDAQSISETTYNICYDTLPSFVAHMAARKGIPVVTLGQGRNGSAKQYGFVVSCALFVKENGLNLVSLMLSPKKPRYVFSFFAQDGIFENLSSSGGRALSIPPHGNMQTRESRRHVERLLDYLRSDAVVSKLDEVTSHSGLPLWSILSPMLRVYLPKRLSSVTGLTLWTEFLMKRLEFDCCVSRDDVSPFRNPMCQVLKDDDVPIVVVQDGLRTNDLTGNYVMPKVGDVHAAWGEYYKKWHVDRGKQPECQVITGFPRHDKLVKLPPVDREAICRRFGLDPKRKVALIATEWFQGSTTRYTAEMDEDYVRLALRSLKPHKDLQIVAKLHPYFQDKCGRIVSEIAEQEGVNLVIAKDSLWELIQLSSFVIVYLSTVAVEALIIGKPVIMVNLVDGRDITGLAQDGLAIDAYDEAGLNRAVRKCLSSPESCVAPDGKRQELLLPFTGPLDGNSSKRVAKLIESQLTR